MKNIKETFEKKFDIQRSNADENGSIWVILIQWMIFLTLIDPGGSGFRLPLVYRELLWIPKEFGHCCWLTFKHS